LVAPLVWFIRRRRSLDENPVGALCRGKLLCRGADLLLLSVPSVESTVVTG
jgi:hypothetical protein